MQGGGHQTAAAPWPHDEPQREGTAVEVYSNTRGAWQHGRVVASPPGAEGVMVHFRVDGAGPLHRKLLQPGSPQLHLPAHHDDDDDGGGDDHGDAAVVGGGGDEPSPRGEDRQTAGEPRSTSAASAAPASPGRGSGGGSDGEARLEEKDPQGFDKRSLEKHARLLKSKAETVQRDVVRAMQAKLDSDHPNSLTVKGHLALALGKLGKHREAETLEREVLRAREAVLGKDHPDTLTSKANLAATLYKLGQHSEAERMLLEVHAARVRTLGFLHHKSLAAQERLENWACMQRRQG